jgi:hypothetical protein
MKNSQLFLMKFKKIFYVRLHYLFKLQKNNSDIYEVNVE